MNYILPKEISNIIYNERCYLTLQDVCNTYYIDYSKFCNYLIENDAILAGSCALHCLDNQCSFNDMDIFVFINKNADIRQCYKKFLDIFTIDQKFITVDKTPLDNDLCEEPVENKPVYFYKFRYLTKSIDMIILYEPAKQVTDKYAFFNLSKIIFDGITWNIPFKNIEYFLEHRQCVITNPYHVFFDEIYDFCPCVGVNLAIESEIMKCINKFMLPNFLNNTNDKMNKIYYEYKEYYSEKTNISILLQKMTILYDKLFDNDYNWPDIIEKFEYKIKPSKSLSELLNNDDSSNELYLEQLRHLYRTYKGVYKILQYISKGYVLANIDEYLY